MKDPITLTYDMCRCYVNDYALTLGPDATAKILGWIRSRNLKALTSCCELLGDALSTSTKYRCAMQVEAFFKKNAAFSEPVKCSAAAHKAFLKAEELCRITNRRLDYYYIKRERLAPDLDFWMSKAEEYIDRTLGDFDHFLGAMPRYVRFTSGATSSRSRRRSLPYLKVTKRPVCTPAALPYIQTIARFFGYGEVRARLTTVNRVEIVPKNWKTFRTIACEPDGNLPLQLAFDGYAKERLRSRGIDLSFQSRNRELARRGSIDGSYATVDLSMASDTIAYNTVAWLFPQPWFEYLCAVRSPSRSGKFGSAPYAKFSSMGNGATFTIETLVFAAACYAVGSRDFKVYGDDIAIAPEFCENLMRFMKFLGFVINQDKSYTEGPFRESCGSNWFEGVDVTPFYIRNVSDLRPELCHNVNGLASVAMPYGMLWEKLRQVFNDHALPLVPFNEDTLTGVFIDVHTAYDQRLIRTGRKHPWVQEIKALRPKSPTRYIGDTRTLFLWYLDRYSKLDRKAEPLAATWSFQLSKYREDSDHPGITVELPLIRSRTPTSSHKYGRKWVHWIPPVAGTPDYLYGWSDFLLHA